MPNKKKQPKIMENMPNKNNPFSNNSLHYNLYMLFF